MLTMNKLRIWGLLAVSLLTGLGAAAQTTPEELAADPEQSAGIYHSYHYRPAAQVAPPKGYVPIYISHYGRHGSRWHASESTYEEPLALLRKADTLGALTPRGRQLLGQVELIAADARGRYGALSPRGTQEHRAIAERMYRAYPEVFSTLDGRQCLIESRSTLVPRCILSMAAFNERLKELNPQITTSRESAERYLSYLYNLQGLRAQGKEPSIVADSLRTAHLNPERLMRSIFTDVQLVPKPLRLMNQLYLMASIMQDVSYLNISLYDLFPADELYQLWRCDNARRYLEMGPSARFGDRIIADAKPLLRNIVETADEVLDRRSEVSATLRFGHDVNVIPLVALMGVKGASARVAVEQVHAAWSVEKVSPMATNVQLIFFRNKAGDVRVRVLHNERDAELPIAGGPYYAWGDLRSYFESLYR